MVPALRLLVTAVAVVLSGTMVGHLSMLGGHPIPHHQSVAAFAEHPTGFAAYPEDAAHEFATACFSLVLAGFATAMQVSVPAGAGRWPAELLKSELGRLVGRGPSRNGSLVSSGVLLRV